MRKTFSRPVIAAIDAAKIFGVPGMGFGAAKVLGWIFTVVILWATVKAARRDTSEVEKPLIWLAILVGHTTRCLLSVLKFREGRGAHGLHMSTPRSSSGSWSVRGNTGHAPPRCGTR